MSGNYLYALEGLVSDPADFHAKHIKSIVSVSKVKFFRNTTTLREDFKRKVHLVKNRSINLSSEQPCFLGVCVMCMCVCSEGVCSEVLHQHRIMAPREV